ncbi:MAG: type II toxin-antitoxin system RelB/DinJ family antitoxin [Kiritimatiellae bacterium]|nr:type II toxin-antitoxin system RelB/DinJ family antitoxin [Kiritimatiellia bacterium]
MTSVLTARVDSEKRKEAERIFSEVGITTSGAINLFICAVALNGGIPFQIGVQANRRTSTTHAMAEEGGGVKTGGADGKYKLSYSFDNAIDAMDAEVAEDVRVAQHPFFGSSASDTKNVDATMEALRGGRFNDI